MATCQNQVWESVAVLCQLVRLSSSMCWRWGGCDGGEAVAGGKWCKGKVLPKLKFVSTHCHRRAISSSGTRWRFSNRRPLGQVEVFKLQSPHISTTLPHLGRELHCWVAKRIVSLCAPLIAVIYNDKNLNYDPSPRVQEHFVKHIQLETKCCRQPC